MITCFTNYNFGVIMVTLVIVSDYLTYINLGSVKILIHDKTEHYFVAPLLPIALPFSLLIAIPT